MDWGMFRAVSPLCEDFGNSRGKPLDRAYIEAFIERNSELIKGNVLEVLRDTYATRFGGTRVSGLEILNLTSDSREATIIADLANCPEVPAESFDCIILTQTLQYIPDCAAAVGNVWRLLKPGGIALISVPMLSRLDAPPGGGYEDCWRFPPNGLRLLLSRYFPNSCISVESHGNVQVALAYLMGLAREDLEQHEIDSNHWGFPVVVTATAMKPKSGALNSFGSLN